VAYVGVVDIHHLVPKSTTSTGAVRDVRDRRDSKFWPKIPKPRTFDLLPSAWLACPASLARLAATSTGSELPLGLALRYSYCYAIGEAMITPDILTEYLLQMMPDAAVTVSDRTGTMDHLKVVVISAAFAGKNLLDRHRLIYQALDVPLKDGRIHALELTAKTTDEA
jgi:stress-induced morphogen